MRALRRGKFRFAILRISRPLKGIFLLALCAAALRLAITAGLSNRLDGLLSAAVSSGGFSRAALSFELGDGRESRGFFDALLGPSALFSKPGGKTTEKEAVSLEDSAEQHESEPEAEAARPITVLPSQMPSGLPDEEAVKAITISPTSESGYETASKLFIKNEAGLSIDIEAMLKAKLPVKFSGDGPHVLIIHTHGSEAYTPDAKNLYVQTDPDRTEDKRFNMIRVGDEVEKILKDRGVSVVHDRNLYDYPSYNGSYSRALEAIGKQMKKTPSIKMIIDIHRDSMTAQDGSVYKTVCEIDGEQASQIMLVMGSNAGGLPHANWKSNLTVAVKLQKIVQEKYPGLMRPINLRKERFNQHATQGSMIVEIGTAGNTLDESLMAARMFSDALASLLGK